MDFRVLGPVELWADHRRVELRSRKLRLVLGILVLEANHMVPLDQLIGLVWPAEVPQSARPTVHSLIYRLRRALVAADSAGFGVRLVTDGPGYRLETDPKRIDAYRFRSLVDQARQAGTDVERCALLAEALRLWRGPVLADVGDGYTRDVLGQGLAESRLLALEDRVESELRLGRHREILAEVTGLVDRHPGREHLVRQLMVIQHHGGNTGAALRTYERTRRWLADELGADPGPELRATHLAILRGGQQPLVSTGAQASDRQTSDRADRGPGPAPTLPFPAPQQLPTQVPGIVGRAAEAAILDSLLAPGSPIVAVVSGSPGVGKTALVLHWAHRVGAEFPGGLLFVNLRGFGPGVRPTEPTEALRGFLEAMGIPPRQVPTTLDAREGLFRSLIANRRVLLVLDNARDTEQVRPLLPGGTGCLAVVTSRRRLTGLAVGEGARLIELPVLTRSESRHLLAGRLTADRAATEPDAVEEIITRCAGLPLALAIVAARAAALPNLPLAALAAQLRDTQGRLDALRGGDETADARAAFSWSYRILSPDAADLFRLLGIHPGPHITLPAAASTAGVPAPRAGDLLVELAAAHLVTEPVQRQFVLHDLLRAYAAELAESRPEPERLAAARRALDHYVHTADVASTLVYPVRQHIPLPAPEPGTAPALLADADHAAAWLAAELPVLLAMVERAVAWGLYGHACRLAWAVAPFLDSHGYWDENATVQTAALVAADRLGDARGQARAHRFLANAYSRLSRWSEAAVHNDEALRIYTALDDPTGQAHIHRSLGLLYERQGRTAEALEHAQRSLAMFATIGEPGGYASALNAVGWYQMRLGEHARAIAYCQEALHLLQELGDRSAEGATWDSLGCAYQQLGQYHEAIRCYQRSVTLLHELGEWHNEASVLTRLGETHDAAGDRAAADASWHHALSIMDAIGHGDAVQVRARLDGVATRQHGTMSPSGTAAADPATP